jgi:hypothetical protein
MDSKSLWLINKELGLKRPPKSRVAMVFKLTMSFRKLEGCGAQHNNLSKMEPFSCSMHERSFLQKVK